MTKKNDNKSLFLYTALIFSVAIVMIIIAFFAQTHLEQSKVSEQDAEKVGLSEKAAQVSEENMQLVELNKNLKENNKTLTEQNDAIVAENEASKKQITNCESLMTIYSKLYAGDKTGAQELLQYVPIDELSQRQKDFYNILMKKAQ